MPASGLRHDVEVFVVAFDPVEGPERREVLAVVARDVADLHPQRHVGVPRHDFLNRVERAVDVAEGAYLHGRRSRAGWRAWSGGNGWREQEPSLPVPPILPFLPVLPG